MLFSGFSFSFSVRSLRRVPAHLAPPVWRHTPAPRRPTPLAPCRQPCSQSRLTGHLRPAGSRWLRPHLLQQQEGFSACSQPRICIQQGLSDQSSIPLQLQASSTRWLAFAFESSRVAWPPQHPLQQQAVTCNRALTCYKAAGLHTAV